MCEPMTLLTMGLSVAQSAAGYKAAGDAAEAQANTVNQNALNAARAADANWRAVSMRERQEGQASLQEKQEQEIAASTAAAAAEVAAGEAGVTGNSVGGVLQGIYGTLGRNLTIIGSNRADARAGLGTEMENVGIGAQNQINSIPLPEKPSLLPYALEAFSSGLGSYTEMKKRNNT